MNELGGYEQLQACLLAEEYVVWRGRPVEGHMLAPNDVFLIPFSIMWGGFAIFWEWSVIITGAPLLFKIWGIPFVLVGLYMMGGRFFVQKAVQRSTYYAITNRRILRCRRGRVSSLDRNAMPQMQMFVNKDGSGTITFGNVRRNSYGYWWSFSGMAQEGANGFSLENVPDVNQVYRILSQQQGGSL